MAVVAVAGRKLSPLQKVLATAMAKRMEKVYVKKRRTLAVAVRGACHHPGHSIAARHQNIASITPR